jgi:hypothetical protein
MERPAGHDAAVSPVDAPNGDAVVTDVVFPVFSLDAGSTWTDLYRDYFGTTGVASCAGDGFCHGGTSQHGYVVSGYLCPPGNKNGCYAGITSPADGGAGLLTPGDSFHQDYISQVLRQEHDAGGGMPKSPDYTFTPVDIERISGWIEAGAPNN